MTCALSYVRAPGKTRELATSTRTSSFLPAHQLVKKLSLLTAKRSKSWKKLKLCFSFLRSSWQAIYENQAGCLVCLRLGTWEAISPPSNKSLCQQKQKLNSISARFPCASIGQKIKACQGLFFPDPIRFDNLCCCVKSFSMRSQPAYYILVVHELLLRLVHVLACLLRTYDRAGRLLVGIGAFLPCQDKERMIFFVEWPQQLNGTGARSDL